MPEIQPDLRVCSFAGGIHSPNPFWLASAPPTNTGEMIMRAFDAGWGGAVWKTIGEPITNVSSRYSSMDWQGQRVVGAAADRRELVRGHQDPHAGPPGRRTSGSRGRVLGRTSGAVARL